MTSPRWDPCVHCRGIYPVDTMTPARQVFTNRIRGSVCAFCVDRLGLVVRPARAGERKET